LLRKSSKRQAFLRIDGNAMKVDVVFIRMLEDFLLTGGASRIFGHTFSRRREKVIDQNFQVTARRKALVRYIVFLPAKTHAPVKKD
jgi:hypothetical protein